jgi:hypothetical protein
MSYGDYAKEEDIGSVDVVNQQAVPTVRPVAR